jgi:hypothetical protein
MCTLVFSPNLFKYFYFIRAVVLLDMWEESAKAVLVVEILRNLEYDYKFNSEIS